MKAIPGLGSFRRNGVNQVITDTIKSARRPTFRIVHYSIQHDHLHLLIESDSRGDMASGMNGFASRLARAVNRFLKRKGSVWLERFHERILDNPRQVRNAIRYVLNNHHKHGIDADSTRPDPFSSGAYFDGWSNYHRELDPTHPTSTVSPPGWHLAVGWKKSKLPIALGSKPG